MDLTPISEETIKSDRESPRLRKARPERIRYTLFDDGAGAIPLDLPAQSHWVPGLIFGAMFVVFAGALVAMLYRTTLHLDRAHASPIALTSPSTLALIAANLLPLFGVLLFGWDLTHFAAPITVFDHLPHAPKSLEGVPPRC